MKNTFCFKKLIIKILRSIIGYLIISLGNVLMIYADLGLNSWGILHQGISLQTPLTFGQASQLLGSTIIVICLMFGTIPGIGTVLNMYFVGQFTDIFKDMQLFLTPVSTFGKFAMLLSGVIFMDIGIFLYLRESIGAGPKDGLMILLTEKSNLDLGLVRTCMEVSAVFFGYILGGKFGIGTIIAAIILGPILRFIFKIFKYDPKKMKHENIIEMLKKIKNSKGDTKA